jgi:hypothetical protein
MVILEKTHIPKVWMFSGVTHCNTVLVIPVQPLNKIHYTITEPYFIKPLYHDLQHTISYFIPYYDIPIPNCTLAYSSYYDIPKQITPYWYHTIIPQNTKLHTFLYHTKSLPYCHDNPTHYIPGSDESSVSTSEGSDSSCEAMEGPHGDDDGLVITSSSPAEDL